VLHVQQYFSLVYTKLQGVTCPNAVTFVVSNVRKPHLINLQNLLF
jgi:hypothetical protein